MADTSDIASASPQAPNPTGLADRYALALLALADDRRAADPGVTDRIAADIEALAKLAAEDATFAAFLRDPRRDARQQRAVAFEILGRLGTGTEVRNLVGVLIMNRRLAILPAVAAAFGARLAARRGVETAHVVSAVPLSDTQRAALLARLTEAGFSNLRLSERVDPGILGGLIVRIGSRLYDSSIKSKLQRLQFAMKGAA
ncbi:MAG: ATP synthase F1 subunit delta [Acetobacteraceae bacterium]|nr:ATP synthase F1 subunit delta [Acetobacteraceae bacterium]MCX7684110.1 ATP synthase F1 subunit delta [Acetobacteraceae bacterium]MDW8399083.1 ATP synthase F1 subunit delta [Acetobacteraceae bacterium]